MISHAGREGKERYMEAKAVNTTKCVYEASPNAYEK
jgi:hypothetical protein